VSDENFSLRVPRLVSRDEPAAVTRERARAAEDAPAEAERQRAVLEQKRQEDERVEREKAEAHEEPPQ
jgi:hypothetical protein